MAERGGYEYHRQGGRQYQGHSYQGGHEPQGGHGPRSGHNPRGGSNFQGGHDRQGGRGEYHGDHERGRRNQSMHYLNDDELQTLSQGNSDDVLVSVNENENRFMNTFKRQHYCKHPRKLKWMIKLLYLLVRCKEEDKATASRILARILSASGEYAFFTTKIDHLLKGMPNEQKDYVRKDNLSCIDQLIEIGQVTIKTIPTTVLQTYPVSVIVNITEELEEMDEKMDLLAKKCEELKNEFKMEKKKAFLKKKEEKKSKSSEGEPPEPFTDLPILPSHKEMHIMPSKVFLRCNKVIGSYESWEHYFDVQFRLLREDFLRPLRQGIEIYSNPKHCQQSTSDIQVYESARVLNPVCLYTGIAFQLHFDSNKLKSVNWEHSRRLIFGSLLCLSNDNFNNCLLFATVVKRNADLLKEGLVTIKFENDVNGFQINPTDTYKMVESTAYYEAYRHILEGLQKLSKNPDVMPMEKYIVSCNYKDMKVPQFLRVSTHPPRFNMADVLWKKNSEEHRRFRRTREFDITDHSLWPQAESAEDIFLNKSQVRALQMALTREVSVIQGPPGTGKTFVGLKIVEAYLKNRVIWDPQKAAPILVICYTNHALDQFLEGINKLIIGSEEEHPNIIRVGGRCKSEVLADCVLNKKVQECRSNRTIPHFIFKEFIEARAALFDCQRDINAKLENTDSQAKQKITNILRLQSVMKPLHFDQMCYAQDTTRGKEMEVWLNLWFPETQEEEKQFSLPLLKDLEPMLETVRPPKNEDVSSSDEDQYINVDNEARVLEDERQIAGEELELPGIKQAPRAHKIIPEKAESKHSSWKTVQLRQGQVKKQISLGFKYEPMTEREVSRVNDVWQLSLKRRWMLYQFWMNEYIKQCKDKINVTASTYNTNCMLYNESQRKIDCHVAQNADVIGMTTTGAAKYNYLMTEIRPKIVIFEEAAEVLEAHIVTSLASSVQQLILIGDHQQLKPKPTCYDLEKNYELSVSLFERLIKNEFQRVTLENQHRMRPEISALICPSIYDKLVDADEVKSYEDVKGVSKNVFFIDHTQPEESNDFNDIKSHVNKHEAEYIVELCHYLLKQDYSPSDITILTMYRGQLLELKKRMKRDQFEGVRVAAVDDFQGEENKIILLSLVRSNSENNIGFLAIDNRVCVSLSRAKEGLYVIGNSSMLLGRHDTVWPKVIDTLKKKGCIGYGLPLYCPVHPDNKLEARVPEDFLKRPEGGCTQLCGMRLPCGHVCEQLCHPKDREHKKKNCSKICSKPLPCGHNCKKRCYECKKTGICAPCSENVKKKLPNCSHTVILLCSQNPLLASCPEPCTKLLSCGHHCPNTCSVSCTPRCKEKVKKKLPCGHKVETYCFETEDSVVCSVKCEAMLGCGDKCSGTCGKCQRGRLHIKCQKKCDRDMVCGHSCKYPCSSICPPCEEKCGNYCFHSKCPKKCYEPCNPCMEPCQWKCTHLKCTKPCGELCNRRPCDAPCKEVLSCNHPCIGLCGEKCPKKCRICDKEEVCEIFLGDEDEDDVRFIELQDCDHIIEVKALDKWINTDTSLTGDSSQVQFKACPKCKTSIRKSLRYGNIIKQTLNDVEAIKRKQIETAGNLVEMYRVALQKLKDSSYVLRDLEEIHQRIKTPQLNSNWYRATAIRFQISMLPNISKLRELLVTIKHSPIVRIEECSVQHLKDALSALKDFMMQDMLSEQQISDCTFELRRLNCTAKLLDLLSKMFKKRCPVSTSDNRILLNQLKQANLSGLNGEKMTEKTEDEIAMIIKSMSRRYEVEGLSQKERVEIVNAIGLSKGHWYKCPNGHFYCIGECGGATERSKCPDCGSEVGGQSHALAAGNRHAGEMDNSSYAAWSEAANMGNFDPADLARLRL